MVIQISDPMIVQTGDVSAISMADLYTYILHAYTKLSVHFHSMFEMLMKLMRHWLYKLLCWIRFLATGRIKQRVILICYHFFAFWNASISKCILLNTAISTFIIKNSNLHTICSSFFNIWNVIACIFKWYFVFFMYVTLICVI